MTVPTASNRYEWLFHCDFSVGFKGWGLLCWAGCCPQYLCRLAQVTTDFRILWSHALVKILAWPSLWLWTRSWIIWTCFLTCKMGQIITSWQCSWSQLRWHRGRLLEFISEYLACFSWLHFWLCASGLLLTSRQRSRGTVWLKILLSRSVLGAAWKTT